MKKTLFFISLILLVNFFSCKTLDTNVSIVEKELPSQFNENVDTNHVVQINWKEYFNDQFLIALIDTALSNNIDLLIALEKIQISKSELNFSKHELLPNLNLNFTGGVRRFGLYTMDGAGNVSTEITPGEIVPINLPDIYPSFQSSWEIDIWGKLRSQKKAALSQYLASIEGVNFIVTNLISEIAYSYYELIALDYELEIIRNTIIKQKEALEVVKIQKEAALTNELAVEQFQLQLIYTQILEKETLIKINEVENKINFLLGRYPQNIKRNKESLLNDFPKEINYGIPSQLLSFRPDIKQAEFEVQKSKFNLHVAKTEFYPSLKITAGVGLNAFKPEYLFLTPSSIAYAALGNLTAPLINRNAIKMKFNNAKSNQIIALYNYQKSIVNAYIEVANEIVKIELQKEINELKEEQYNVSNKAVETSLELYKTAKASYIEVLLIQQNNLQINLEWIDIKKRQQLSKVKIYQALGGGWN